MEAACQKSVSFWHSQKKTPNNATDVHYFALEAKFTIVVPIVSPS